MFFFFCDLVLEWRWNNFSLCDQDSWRYFFKKFHWLFRFQLPTSNFYFFFFIQDIRQGANNCMGANNCTFYPMKLIAFILYRVNNWCEGKVSKLLPQNQAREWKALISVLFKSREISCDLAGGGAESKTWNYGVSDVKKSNKRWTDNQIIASPRTCPPREQCSKINTGKQVVRDG